MLFTGLVRVLYFLLLCLLWFSGICLIVIVCTLTFGRFVLDWCLVMFDVFIVVLIVLIVWCGIG